jgi:hypothetical protein
MMSRERLDCGRGARALLMGMENVHKEGPLDVSDGLFRSIVTAAGKGAHDIGLCIVNPRHRKDPSNCLDPQI